MTIEKLLDCVPDEWRGEAELCIGDDHILRDAVPVKRIALHEDVESGRKVIALYDAEIVVSEP